MNTREKAVSDALKELINHISNTDEEGTIDNSQAVIHARAALAMPIEGVEPETVQATPDQMIASNEALDYMGFALLRNGIDPTKDEVQCEVLARSLLVYVKASNPIGHQAVDGDQVDQLTH